MVSVWCSLPLPSGVIRFDRRQAMIKGENLTSFSRPKFDWPYGEKKIEAQPTALSSSWGGPASWVVNTCWLTVKPNWLIWWDDFRPSVSAHSRFVPQRISTDFGAAAEIWNHWGQEPSQFASAPSLVENHNHSHTPCIYTHNEACAHEVRRAGCALQPFQLLNMGWFEMNIDPSTWMDLLLFLKIFRKYDAIYICVGIWWSFWFLLDIQL